MQNSVEKLKNAGIILPSEEMLYITSLLLGIKTTSFAMAIFPRIAGMFAAGFGALTEYSRKTLASSKYGQGREFIVAVNDALGYGEAATLTTGLLVIPFAILIGFILPGNLVIPLMVLPSLPYMVEIPVSLSNGNVVKS